MLEPLATRLEPETTGFGRLELLALAPFFLPLVPPAPPDPEPLPPPEKLIMVFVGVVLAAASVLCFCSTEGYPFPASYTGVPSAFTQCHSASTL